MNVLIVDDDEVDRERLKRILLASQEAAEIFEASTVEEGLKIYHQAHFDIVLLDYRMPKRDGIEMLKELRALPKEGSVAIVMMSTAVDEGLALECLKAGAQDFVPKEEVTEVRLMRAIAHAHTRFELEKELWASYKKVKALAESDSLTGLANRYLFDETLKLSLSANERYDHKIALILFDVDNFKFVNDTYGHDVGDLLLQSIVSRIKRCLRGSELFCRLGGDEFAITISSVSDVKSVSIIVNRIKGEFTQPFLLNEQNVASSISLGIAIHPDNAGSASELYKQADIALYRAKQNGKDRICFFESDMQEEFSRRFIVEQELREAVLDEDMFLLYQPIYCAASKSIVGAEALLRWRCNAKVRSPDAFVSIAEDSHMINRIGRWVISKSLIQLLSWQERLNRRLCVSVNLSPKQLLERDLVDFVERELKRNGVDPKCVQFELTETAFFEESERVNDNIQKLDELGCLIALDDFGTGFSSISHLRNFPIDTVKIDKSILPNNERSDKDRALFSGLCSMLRALDIDIVVEGVETQAQVTLCESQEAHRLQGYFFAKPMLPKDFELIFGVQTT